jgi:hypothetical protein
MPITSQMQGTPSIVLPTPAATGPNQVVNVRTDQYGNLSVNNRIPTKGALALEGVYYSANNAQSGIATAAAVTAFSAVNPFLTIWNTASASNTASAHIVLDYISLVATAAGTGGTSLQCAVVIDSYNRYTSGGTALTPQKSDSYGAPSIAQVYAGNIVAAAALSSARTPVGLRYLKGAIPVAGDTYTLQFGSVDSVSSLQAATITFSEQHMPPIAVNPGEIALVYIWLPSQSAASSYAPEIGWYEV